MRPAAARRSAVGPMRPFAGVCFARRLRASRQAAAGRGSWWGGRLRRLRCDARTRVAPHNSLRSLRSLRSNRCVESVNEARCARRPQGCAFRRPTNRPCRLPPAARQARWCSTMRHATTGSRPEGGAAPGRLCAAEEANRDTSGPGDRLCLASGRASRPGAACKARARGRARSALRELTRRTCSSAANAANVASCATGHEAEMVWTPPALASLLWRWHARQRSIPPRRRKTRVGPRVLRHRVPKWCRVQQPLVTEAPR